MSDFLSSGNWSAAGIAIAEMAFLQTTVVLAATLGTAWIFQSRGATVRSAVLRAGLVAIVICPLVSASLRYSGMPGLKVMPALAAAPAITSDADSLVAPAGIRVDHQRGVEEPSAQRVDSNAIPPQAAAETLEPSTASVTSNGNLRSSRTVQMSRVIVILWIAISALLIARLVIANIWVTLVRRGARPACLATQLKCREIAKQLRVRTPAVLVTPATSAPCLVGWLRPVILLPRDGRSVEREILIHELAHVARRDTAWHLMTRLAVAAVWFQPLIWIWARELERTAEEACDDAVVAGDGNCTTYVRELAELADRAQRRWALADGSVGVVGIRSSAGRRIARLLNATNRVSTQLRWRGRLGIGLGAAVLVIGIGVIRPHDAKTAHADEVKPAGADDVRCSGRVLDADGKPVEGAEVFAVSSRGLSPKTLATVRTDAVGNFTLSYGKPRSERDLIQIEAFAAGKGVAMARVTPTQECELRLLPKTQSTLTILNPQGLPLSGLRVFPTTFMSSFTFTGVGQPVGPRIYIRMPLELSRQMAETTALDGSVTFRDLPLGTRFELGFDDDRFAYPALLNRILLSDTDEVSSPATIRLESAASISGVVRFGRTGRPVPGIDVTAQGTDRERSSGGGYATTNENGQFQIKHLTAGEFNVMLALTADMRKEWTAAAHEWVTLKPGQNLKDIDFSLIKGGVVTGKVTMADSGKPITETYVGAHGPANPRSSAMVNMVMVGADGSYTMRVPPGVQYVYVAGLLPAAYQPDRQLGQDVKVEDGQTVTVDFKMPRRAGYPVDGVVLGPDGKPAIGITVRGQRATSPTTSDVFTTSHADGRFHFESLAAGTDVSVREDELGTAEPTKVVEGKNNVTLRLVRRAKVTGTGLVTDDRGKPIAGARIRLTIWFGYYGLSEGDPFISATDGRYQIKGLYSDTQYNIAASADGYGEAQATLKSDDLRELPTLKLPRADAITSGVVVNSDGKPIDGIRVHLDNGYPQKTTLTDSQGRFSFRIDGSKEHLVWLEVKDQSMPRPTTTGAAGYTHLKLVLPKGDE